MARDKELMQLRAERIEKLYGKWRNKKVNGKQLYTHEAILEKIAKQVFITPATIEDILNGRRE